MTREEIEARVRDNFDAWNRQDADGVVEIFAADAAVSDNSNEVGREGMRTIAQDFWVAFPDLHLDVLSLHVDGDTAFTEWRATGTHQGTLMGIPASGRRVDTVGVGVDEFGEDGQVHRSALYWDTAKLLQDIGVLPAAQPAGASA